MSKQLGRLGWGLMTFLSLGIVLLASRYLSLNPDVFFPQQRNVYIVHELGIMTHVVGGVLALGVGPFLFLGRLRAKRPAIHRWLGRIYLVGILLGSMAGFYMAFYAYAGIAASLGLGLLAVAWFYTGLEAYRAIRRGDTASHRAWMIRNFGLTFAGVTLRLWMPLTIMLFGASAGYEVVAWLCWVPNLIVAESIIRGWFRGRLVQTAQLLQRS